MSCDIRPMAPEEAGTVADLWYRTGREAYPYLPGWQSMTPDLALRVFREHVAARCDVFVAEQDGVLAGYLAMTGSYIDRLYIDPALQGRGIGTALIEHARRRCPGGLELHTHQQNASACAFYEHLGFVAVRFGTSPPPESAPDVEYHWRP
jgi:GNAT superfamily N-acetyltransferase